MNIVSEKAQSLSVRPTAGRNHGPRATATPPENGWSRRLTSGRLGEGFRGFVSVPADNTRVQRKPPVTHPGPEPLTRPTAARPIAPADNTRVERKPPQPASSMRDILARSHGIDPKVLEELARRPRAELRAETRSPEQIERDRRRGEMQQMQQRYLDHVVQDPMHQLYGVYNFGTASKPHGVKVHPTVLEYAVMATPQGNVLMGTAFTAKHAAHAIEHPTAGNIAHTVIGAAGTLSGWAGAFPKLGQSMGSFGHFVHHNPAMNASHCLHYGETVFEGNRQLSDFGTH
ncbi:MAG: hypothetical protein HY319_18960 [Armatimonadetes bacterium]|nr:hypothetical protein [Armatimonadota bacterium]